MPRFTLVPGVTIDLPKPPVWRKCKECGGAYDASERKLKPLHGKVCWCSR